MYRLLEPFMLSKRERADAERVMQEIRQNGFRSSYYGQFAKKAEAVRSQSCRYAPHGMI
jgi:hypothetical protein